MDLDKQIEAVLFFKNEAISFKQLSEFLDRKEAEIQEAFGILENKLKNRGIKIIFKDDKVMLGTSPEMYDIIEKIRKEELSKDIGKAGLETLTVVLYKGPVAKPEIDYIRGVNSGSILRNLLVRGLIERKNGENKKSFLYYPTFELLSFIGISKLEELPEYNKIKKSEENREIIESEENKKHN